MLNMTVAVYGMLHPPRLVKVTRQSEAHLVPVSFLGYALEEAIRELSEVN
jgi:hypothetical protein